jgi:alanyl-tRNA synthetase
MELVTTYENLGTGHTHFVGYTEMERESVVAALLVDNASTGHASRGQRVEVVLESTPFYAESGGQVGDRGTITGPNGVVRVENTQRPVAGLIVHQGVVAQGDISLGETVRAAVESSHRLDAARNHSGTHLLHAALRSVLGPHVRQAGSLVTADRLRFDFSHVSALSPQEQLSVQQLANGKIRDNLHVSTHETSYAEAVRQGALAFFGDRYGDVVRVVSMSNGEAFSVEVCGGTHVGATGQVGTLFVLGESSIGGGMRRIEAVTGRAAEQLFLDQSAKLEAISRKLQTPVADLEARLDSFLQDTEELRRRLETLERGALRTEAEALLRQVQDVNGVPVVVGRTSATNPEGMREMGDFLKARLGSVVVALGAVVNGNPILVVMVTPDLVARGLHAGNIARDTARVMGGGGGGQPEMAQAGGRLANKLDEALRGVAELVRQGLEG